MKKLFLLPLLVVGLNSFAGWEMTFCDSTDEKGNCIGKIEAFNLTGQEIQFNVLLTNKDGLHTAKIYFEIYVVDPTTYTENLVTTEEIKTEQNSLFVAHTMHLSKKGTYLIKARDSYKDYITSRELIVR